MKNLYFSQVDTISGKSSIAMDSDFLIRYRPWEVGALESKNILTPELNLNYDEVNKDLTVIFRISAYKPLVYLKDLYAVVYEVGKFSNNILGNVYLPACDGNGLFAFTLSNIIVNPGSVIMVKTKVFDMFMDSSMSFTNVVTAV